MTSGELAELHAAHDILLHAYEYLADKHVGRKDEFIADCDSMMILLDARVVIQEKIFSFLVGDQC